MPTMFKNINIFQEIVTFLKTRNCPDYDLISFPNSSFYPQETEETFSFLFFLETFSSFLEDVTNHPLIFV